MTPLSVWKLRKNRGGKEAIEKMSIVAGKHYAGKKLTEDENRLFDQYNAYLADKTSLENAIPYTSKELKLLHSMAVPYMKSSKMKINGGLAFWTTLGAIQFDRVIKIFQA